MRSEKWWQGDEKYNLPGAGQSSAFFVMIISFVWLFHFETHPQIGQVDDRLPDGFSRGGLHGFAVKTELPGVSGGILSGIELRRVPAQKPAPVTAVQYHHGQRSANSDFSFSNRLPSLPPPQWEMIVSQSCGVRSERSKSSAGLSQSSFSLIQLKKTLRPFYILPAGSGTRTGLNRLCFS